MKKRKGHKAYLKSQNQTRHINTMGKKLYNMIFTIPKELEHIVCKIIYMSYYNTFKFSFSPKTSVE